VLTLVFYVVVGGIGLMIVLAFMDAEKASSRRRSAIRQTTERRAIAPPSDLEVLDTSRRGELEDEVRDQARRKETYYRLTLASGERLAVGYTAGDDWLDVITRKRKKGEKGGRFTGPYDVFGYNMTAGRWSYGEGPAGAGEIRKLLAGAFGAKERGRWS
jgi:hypothetical protein